MADGTATGEAPNFTTCIGERDGKDSDVTVNLGTFDALDFATSGTTGDGSQ